MIYDFDTPINRRVTGSVKWQNLPQNVIPMNIADMEFRGLPEVSDALRQVAKQGDFGYIGMTDDDKKAVADWLNKRRGVVIPVQDIVPTLGVLYSARIALSMLTKVGDKVVVQTPLHTPSIATPCVMDRQKVENRLIYKDGKYYIDYEDLENHFKQGAKVLMLCAPHNPTGRVWTEDEMQTIGEIVAKYDGYVISDEIHSDVIWGEKRHVSPTQIPILKDRSIAVYSTSKTFNMGGFHIGTAIIPNPILRERFVTEFYKIGHDCNRPAVSCIRAQTTAYTKGEEWYKQMLNYVESNIDYALSVLKDTPIKATKPDGTFLLWADISSLNWTAEKLQKVMLDEWRVLLDPGSYYDTKDWSSYKGLEHHVRLNLALPKSTLIEALDRIKKYF